jgi:hypothetical protein
VSTVYVTPAQKSAAQYVIARAAKTGRAVSPALRKIAAAGDKTTTPAGNAKGKRA